MNRFVSGHGLQPCRSSAFFHFVIPSGVSLVAKRPDSRSRGNLPFVGPSYTVREKQGPSTRTEVLARDDNTRERHEPERSAGRALLPTRRLCHRVPNLTSPCDPHHFALGRSLGKNRTIVRYGVSLQAATEFQVGWRIVRCTQVPSDGPANRKGSNGQRFGADRSRAL